MDAGLLIRVYQTLIGIVGVVGNGLVCLVIYRVSSMHTTTNAFIFNQAAIDLLGSLVMAVRSNMPALPVPVPGGIVGYLLCKIYNAYAVQFSLFDASTYNLMTVTLERYVAIVYPYTYPRIFGKRKAVAAFLIAGWVLGFVVSCTAAAVINYHHNGYCARQTGSGALGVVVAMVNFFIPSLVMLVSYIHITVVLKRSADQVAPGLATLTRPASDQQNQDGTTSNGTAASATQQETQRESLLRARRNTFKTLLLVFVVFVLCWLPHSTIFLVFDLGGGVHFSPVLFFFGAVTLSANVCVNPFIYAVKYKQFRAGFRKIFGLRPAAINLLGSQVMARQSQMPAPPVPVPGGIAGYLLCKIDNGYAILQWSLFTVSTNNLMAVALEPWIAINNYHGGKCAQNTSLGVLGVAIAMLNFFISLLVMWASYSHITVVLKRSADRVALSLAIR
ncbi:galanin receptor type 2-like [Acanthaster planci]|uniref:Galanin receptor type 2-like n=1 Tax=Acanthaster planci TaxID=133434 RepID=A0A8B7XX74_ACAPL|nr:galanin receptor type 2-like [Acanthaster planci]